VEAEKKAWEMAGQQSEWELIVLNPSFVMGPSLTSVSQSESIKFMTELLSGKQKSGTAELSMGYVDVRDVAKAHIYCVENKSSGRHILSERVTDMLSFVQIVRDLYGDRYKLPKSYLPKWLLSLIGGLFGLSREFVKKNVGIPIALDATKSKEKLKLSYTPLEQTVKDMVDQMENT
jgi:nucleoside-diphosphate-sugar epimerase